MSSHVGRQVDSIVERKLLEDPAGRLKKHIDAVVERHLLSSTLRVPDCASDIEVCVNLARKTISCSITVKAPGDRKSTKARLSWLLRMLPSDHEHVLIRAHWPGRAAPTMKGIVQLREEPELLQAENNGLVPHSFEILMVGRRADCDVVALHAQQSAIAAAG